MNKYINAFKQLFQGGGANSIFLISCLGVFILSMALKTLVSGWIISLSHKIISKTKFNVDKEDFDAAKKPIEILFVATTTIIAIYALGSLKIENNSSYIVLLNLSYRIYKAAMIIAFSVLIYALVPAFMHMYQRMRRSEADNINPIVLIFLERAFRLLVVIICIVAILSELGINVNGLITGIGLGGLTFALAAQDTAANIFGGMVIISDKPFSVGDWIQSGTIEGHVEDITFRSTRIRTFDDALIIVPNNKLTSEAITNWTKMNKRRIRFNMGLTYSTTPAALRNIVDEIRYYLKNHEEIIPDTVLVRLEDFAPSSLSILVQMYVNATQLQDLKRIREEINYQIMEIVTNNGTSFAFPSTTVYMHQDTTTHS